jgi:RNA polymerase sigma-70 factor, ECF subfamily
MDEWVWRACRGFASFRAVTSAGNETAVTKTDRAASDVDLVTRMSKGDRAALAELYDRYAPALLGLGARMLGDRKEAEDLVHDVFLEAWQSAALYDQTRGTVATWLILRMRSRTLDRMRSAGRKRTVLVGQSVPSEESAPDDPYASADRKTLLRALEELPAEQRAVLELGYFAGLSSSEIANEIGISIGTVKSRTAAGLSKLRARFAPKEGGRR